MEPLTLDKLKQRSHELLSALAVIEDQYPDYELTLTPKRNRSLVSANGTSNEPKTNRQLVSEACRAKALSISELVEATDLEKSQIRGVLNAPGESDNYERTDQEDGSKLYKYIGD